MKIALQLYTVRDETERDYEGTLRKVAQIGYPSVETGWPNPLAVDKWKQLKAEIGLGVVTTHALLEELENHFGAVAQFCKDIGCAAITCPYAAEERRRDAAGYRNLAGALNRIGRRCREHGLQFYYHNHSFEFQQLGGTCGLELLFENTDRDCVMFELDTYWIRHGGKDPAEVIKKYSGRCGLIHIKDMTGDERHTFAEIGEGILNFHAIFAAARDAGTTCMVVEQDACDRPPLESAEISLRNIKNNQY